MKRADSERMEAARLHALHCPGCSEYGGHGEKPADESWRFEPETWLGQAIDHHYANESLTTVDMHSDSVECAADILDWLEKGGVRLVQVT